MKNAIVNIYKTLFFFDFSIILVYYTARINHGGNAFSQLLNDALFFGIMLIFSLFFSAVVQKEKPKIFGGKYKLRKIFIGLLYGAIPVGVTYGFIKIFAKFSVGAKPDMKFKTVFFVILAMLLNAAANEMLLRGYLFKLYRKFYGFVPTAVIITALFISLNPDMFKLGKIYSANLILTNLILCLLAETTKSLLAPIVIRFTYYIAGEFLFGLLYSVDGYNHLFNATVTGKKLITGGNLMIEGSVVFLTVNVLIFMIILLNSVKISGIKNYFGNKGKRKKTFRYSR